MVHAVSGRRSSGLTLMAAAAMTSALLCATPSSAATVYLNDQFNDNERLTQALPNSADWTVGAHHTTAASAFGTLDASGGSLLLDHTSPSGGGGSFVAAWSHFTAAGAPVTLNVNERMTLSFTVLFDGTLATGNGAFRWALLNSGGSRVSDDFAGTNETGIASGTTFSGWRGYEGQSPAATTISTGSPDLITRERTGSGNGLFVSANWTAQSGSGVVEPSILNNIAYPASLVLTRTAGGMQVQASFAGATTNLVTDATPVTAFDSVALFALDVLPADLRFDDISVSVDVIPEPSAALLLAAAGGGLLLRRRRAARG